MDIFAYANSINWLADYYDHHTGYIYGITNAWTNENGKKVIPVYIDKSMIGTVTEE